MFRKALAIAVAVCCATATAALVAGTAVATPRATSTSTTASSTTPGAVGLPFFDGQLLYPTTQPGTYASQPSTSSDGSLVTQITYTPGASVAIAGPPPDPTPTAQGDNPDSLGYALPLPTGSVSAFKKKLGVDRAQAHSALADSSSWTYRPGPTAGFKWANDDGEFSGQVVFPAIPLHWGWNFSTLVKTTALSEGSELASAYTWPQGKKINYGDDHVYTVYAVFHSKITQIAANKGYQLAINFNWGCEGPLGPGKCLLYVRHYFHVDP